MIFCVVWGSPRKQSKKVNSNAGRNSIRQNRSYVCVEDKIGKTTLGLHPYWPSRWCAFYVTQLDDVRASSRCQLVRPILRTLVRHGVVVSSAACHSPFSHHELANGPVARGNNTRGSSLLVSRSPNMRDTRPPHEQGSVVVFRYVFSAVAIRRMRPRARGSCGVRDALGVEPSGNLPPGFRDPYPTVEATL